MKPLLFLPILLLAVGTPPMTAQSGNAIVAAGYRVPTDLTFAPGQLVTLFVDGLGADPGPSFTAENLPLPTNLRGISVLLKEAIVGETPVNEIPVPILRVQTIRTCSGDLGETCGTLTAVTIQIPFEMHPGAGRRQMLTSELVVSHFGVRGRAVRFRSWSVNLHVVTTCDTVGIFDLLAPRESLLCPPIVTHVDGRLVTDGNPARGGEILVMYALGLGRTTPPVKSGYGSPDPAPVTEDWETGALFLSFDFRPNAPPTRPLTEFLPPHFPNPNLVAPLFAGLVPGFVGLYQINFTVPEVAPDIRECGGGEAIVSNLTVTLTSLSSIDVDGAGICITPRDEFAGRLPN